MTSKQVINDLNACIENVLCWGYKLNKHWCLVEIKGCYTDNNTRTCHLLETVLLGRNVVDCINVDIAKALKVSLYWVDGFADGYGGKPIDGDYYTYDHHGKIWRDYAIGYRDGEKMKKLLFIETSRFVKKK